VRVRRQHDIALFKRITAHTDDGLRTPSRVRALRRENSDPEDGHSNGNSPEDAEAILGLLTPLLHPTVAERISRRPPSRRTPS
jgi:hypothetical protein